VREQVGDRLDVGFEDLGEHSVKNISRPIPCSRRLSTRERRATVGSAAKEDAARVPSIAVLPLVNMSGDPDQEFFADGLTEDIITEVSRFRDLLVISAQRGLRAQGQTRHGSGIAEGIRRRLRGRGKCAGRPPIACA
jgi:adenylate cyclase